MRRVVATFKNTASQECIVGYPGADLVTPAGGVLINVARRPANAAHRLRLTPGDKAIADVQSYAVAPRREPPAHAMERWWSPRQTDPSRERFPSTYRSATRVSSVD
ncbi:DUF4232 domain-containing protein [Candidatus Mycolicibacterium alkanivorans]|uniref:DUF4232 domain-containing protein n=1 Tax=Candidatus Mycolicibacterium alkanivorans TaxID=2954114 RepID=A0ABS9YVQ3_9MYCO|nr:DUF4232 domain-containing protein [Candidatus Mycolicibacterium alkanivorans]MCI4674853.1 DUF4232 domain-containing protein [Candidatus Mycolicibacterium alkanivorans]